MKDTSGKFKAVEFMYEARARLTKLYFDDKEKYFTQLEKATREFIKARKKKVAKAI